MSDISTQVITLTDNAISELLVIKEKEGHKDNAFLRIGVEGGGCSGLSYILKFDEQTKFDAIHQIKGLDVLIDKRHELYVLGMEVDYEYGLNDRGFIFNNPNASGTCGCGTSFSV